MKITLVFLVILTVPIIRLNSQKAIYDKHPHVLRCSSDTVNWIIEPGSNEIYSIKLREGESVSPGTDGRPGLTQMLYTPLDTVVIPYDNFPYYKEVLIDAQSPNGIMSTIRLRFNAVSALFDQEYMNSQYGQITIDIPEVYELANIIWSLSSTATTAININLETEYFGKVKKYFAPYLLHPIFQKLTFPDSIYFDQYYSFRENSFLYKFDGEHLINEGPYYYVHGDDWDGFSNLFNDLLPLIEDFAKKSNFRSFYEQNSTYYSQLIERQKELLRVKNMWDWLEDKFPSIKYHSYKVIFSPLIGGSHSTQNYATLDKQRDSWYRETIMFICADRYSNDSHLRDDQRAGLMSGILFTEIDHNYVNRISRGYQEQINLIFKDRNTWASKKVKSYNTPMDVFNEYMTHSLYSLWVLDNFEKNTALYLIAYRERLNECQRGFIRFAEFNKALIELCKEHPNSSMETLYPQILEWCQNFAE